MLIGSESCPSILIEIYPIPALSTIAENRLCKALCPKEKMVRSP